MEAKQSCKSNITKGTTAAAYAEALRVDTRGMGVQGKFFAIVTNLDPSNTMYYKIDGYPADVDGTLGGKPVTPAILAETSLAASTTAIPGTLPDKGYAAVVISVKNNSGACAYQIDWETY